MIKDVNDKNKVCVSETVDIIQEIPLKSIAPNPSQPQKNSKENENTKLPDSTPQRTKTIFVPIELLEICESNPRKHDVILNIEGLKESIKREQGVTEPIHVWFDDKVKKYMIIAGQRRFLASKDILKEIECIFHLDIHSIDDAKKWCRREYGYREDLHPLDKLKIAEDLTEQYGSLRNGCQAEGLPYETYKKWYSLRRLSDDIKTKMGNGSPQPGLKELVEISRLPPSKQLETLETFKISKIKNLQTLVDDEAADVTCVTSSDHSEVKVESLVVWQVIHQKDGVLKDTIQANELIPAYVKDLKILRRFSL